MSVKWPSRSSRSAKATAWTRMSSSPSFGVPVLEDLADLVVVADVGAFDEGRADGGGQRPNAALDQRRHRAEPDVGALVVERLGDAPGDRVVVGDAEDEGLLALQQPFAGAVVGWTGEAAASGAGSRRGRFRTAAAAIPWARPAASRRGTGVVTRPRSWTRPPPMFAAMADAAGCVGRVSFISGVRPSLAAGPGAAASIHS